MRNISLSMLVAGLVMLPSVTMANDFTTAARVQFVLECMDGNPKMNVYEGVNKCSCVADELAKHFTQREFEEANTGFQFRNLPADRGAMFRDDDAVTSGIKSFKHIYADAYKTCRIRH
jgi:hypothetical protein